MTLAGTWLLILTYRTYSLFNSYKVTDKQSCGKIKRIFTFYPDPEGTAKAEAGFKEKEDAGAVEVVKEVKEREIKQEP